MADFSRVSGEGWRQGDDGSDQARTGTDGWWQVTGASSSASAVLAATGSSGAFAGTANSVSSVSLAAAGASGNLVVSAFSSAVVAAAVAGATGVFAGSASVPATVALAVTGASGAFSGSAAVAAGSSSLGGAYFDVLSGRLMILRKR